MLLISSISGIHSFFSNTRRHLAQHFNSLFPDVVYTFTDVVGGKTNNYLVSAEIIEVVLTEIQRKHDRI